MTIRLNMIMVKSHKIIWTNWHGQYLGTQKLEYPCHEFGIKRWPQEVIFRFEPIG